MNFFGKGNNNGTPSRLGATLRQTFMRTASSNISSPASKQAPTDNIPVLLYCAAQCLSNSIEEILSDTSSLTGENLSGFQRLLDILDDETTSDDMVYLSSGRGYGCLQTMLNNMDHPKFIEICNQATLATALMHALRLIRMLEIKKCKLITTNASEVGHFSTVKTTERVAKVMKYLCTDSRTIEQIRLSIVKLLIFPLGVLPASALHIQDQSAGIVSTICRTGFNSQQVWYLHDAQAVTHMVRHLNELTVIEGSDNLSPSGRMSLGRMSNSSMSPAALMAAASADEPPEDELLKGLAAERRGMWAAGMQCVVEVIACTMPISTVLMSDFETAGGNKLFIHMLKNAAPERFMVLINTICQLMFDPDKTADEPMISTAAGAILLDFLRELLHLRQSIKHDLSVETLMAMADTIYKSRHSLQGREFMIQSMAYSLLTIYSNNPQNCSALEEIYNFLPMLILVIPSIAVADSISAVLTALNFVCLCVESCAGLPMTALCAASAVIIQQALKKINDTDAEKTFTPEEEAAVALQLDLIFQTIEGILRNNQRYAMALLNNGFLQHAIYDPFVNLCTQVLLGADVKPQSIPIFAKAVQMLLSIISKTSEAADEVRDSGLTLIIKNLVSSRPVSREFSQMLLRLTKQLARSDESHLKDSFNTIFTTMPAVESDFGKLRQLADTLAIILLENENSPALCYAMGGMEYTVASLHTFQDQFSQFIAVYGVDYSHSAVALELVQSLESVMRVLAFQIRLSSPQPVDAEFLARNLVFRRYYEVIADALFASGIFSSAFVDQGLDFVFQLIAGFTGQVTIVNAAAVEILVKLMARFDSALFNVALERFCVYAESCESSSKLLNEAGIVCQLIEYFHPIFHDPDVSYDHPIFKLFRQLTQNYLTVESFVALFKYIVRPVLLPGECSFKLMQPWEAYSTECATASWRALQYLTSLTAQSPDRVQAVPFVSLGTARAVQKWSPAYLSVSFEGSGSHPFPLNGFSYSCWFKVPALVGSGEHTQIGEVVPILSLSSGECFFEVHADLENGFIRVATISRNGTVASLQFRPALPLRASDWTSLVLVVRKTKKLTTGLRVGVSVYINGVACDGEGGDNVNMDPSAFNAAVIGMEIGKLNLILAKFAPEVSQEDGRLMKMLCAPADWHLGPAYLFDEVLTAEQVACVFVKGPKYTGNFSAEAPLGDCTASLASSMYYRCNVFTKTADAFMDLLGLGHLEAVSLSAHHHEDLVEYEHPSLPAPVVAINAACMAVNRDRRVFETVTRDSAGNLSSELDAVSSVCIDGDVCIQIPDLRYSLVNTAVVEFPPLMASVENGYFHYNSTSVADCLSAVGGPELLLPLVQAASSEAQINEALAVLRYSVRHNVNNLQFMQSCGYRMLAFILSMKPSNLLTERVVNALMDLAVDRSVIDVRASTESLFLIDSTALHTLLLNHHVWEARRFNITYSLVSKLLDLVLDERYSFQNAKRLSALKVTRWVLMLSAYSVSLLDPQPRSDYDSALPTPPRKADRKRSWTEKDLSDIKEEWLFDYPTANQMAEYRDAGDAFLVDAMQLANRVIGVDIRKKDIELIAKMVMYTFESAPNPLKSQTGSRRSPRPASLPHSPVLQVPGKEKRRDKRTRASSADITDNGTINLPVGAEDGDAQSTSCPFCNYYEPQPGEGGDDDGQPAPFTPMAVFRVYLLRLLFTVYDGYLEELRWSTGTANATANGSHGADGARRTSFARNVDKDVFEFFRSACSPAWFLAVLEHDALDIATKTCCLRLLCLFVQKDATFLREFSSQDGFKILHTILTAEAQEVSVVLPLIAMLFRIPVQVLLHPFQIKSVDKFLQVLNLEECLGPDNAEPGLSELTIPLLSLLVDCLTNACRAKDDPTKRFGPLIDLLLGVLKYAIGKMTSFKRLIQRRAAIEILCVAVLSCSSGFNDFGAQIYRTDDDLDSDLSTVLQEDYISQPPYSSAPAPVGNSPLTLSAKSSFSVGGWSPPPAYEVPKTSDVRLVEASEVVNPHLDIRMVGTEGEKMTDIVSMSMHYALMELENVHTLIYYLVSYPMAFMPCYEQGFQKFVISTFTGVVNNLLSKNFEPVLMLHIADLITYLTPLVRGNLLFDDVLFDVFKLSIRLTRVAIDVPYSNSQDRVRAVIKEIGNTARFFSFACINRQLSRDMRQAVFSIIRENMDILFHPALEDIGDLGLQATASSMFPRRVGSETAVGTGNAAILEAVSNLGVGLGNARKVSVWSLPYVKADRNRVAQVFWLYMTNACYGLVLEDDTAVRIEATRILAYLSVNRGTLMEQVLGNYTIVAPQSRMWAKPNTTESAEEAAMKAAKEVDIFRDGFSKLVPDASGRYEIFLRGATDDNESEENRFADFSFWISDNNAKCDKTFYAVESALQWVIASAAEVEEIRRQLEYVSANNTTNTGLVAVQNNAKGKDHIDAVKNALAATEKMRRAEAGSKQRDQVLHYLLRFETFGLSSLAAGAYSWRRAWNTVQCGPLWGYLPLRYLRRDRSQEDNPTVGSGGHFFGTDDADNGGTLAFHKAWYLNFTEGPEHMRRKMEQDFSVPLLLARNEKKNAEVVRRASLFLDGSAGSPTKTAASGEEVSIQEGSEQEDDGMESFLKKIAKEGLIRRVEDNDLYFEKDEGEEEEYLALQDAQVAQVAQGDTDTSRESVGRRSSESRKRNSETRRRPSTGTPTIAIEEVDPSDTAAQLANDLALTIKELSASAEIVESAVSLKDRGLSPEVDEEEDIEEGDESLNDPVSGRGDSLYASTKVEGDGLMGEENTKTRRSAMLVEIVKGIIGANEWAKGKVFNVKRIYGLEAHISMLVLTPNNIHILCGFVAIRTKKGGKHDAYSSAHCILEWVSPLQQKQEFDKYNTTNPSPSNGHAHPELCDSDWVEEIWKELLRSDLGYSHIPLSEVYSFFRRRHQLKYTALEVTDIKGYSVLYSCDSVMENEHILVELLESDLPSSIFNRVVGIHQLQLLRSIGSNVSSNVASNVYNRLVSLFVNQVTGLWQHGEMSNFEYLMHINAAAGRSFQDLTQYPVFPWVIADYSSETLDLDNPLTFRDLTKPMGAIGPRREQQYRDRYQTMDEFYRDGIEGASPPFYYGTHYSCAGYVLHYLIRLQPFADMSVALQGGHFDKADRLFLSVENSWLSASQENLQDVRELIPEFFYLPEFLTNANNFDLGSTQRDAVVQDVTLPPWARGDPHEFIRLQRAALESKYVSQNLHHWIDLIFGFKQRGQAAIDALNVFIHITYEGEIDVDAITDPVMRTATISQINNFGQTPSRVFRKPHPQKIVPDSLKRVGDGVVADPYALNWHAHLSPALSVVGAPSHNILSRLSYLQATYFGNIKGLPVGDVRLVRERLVAVPLGSALVPPLFKRAIRVGGVPGSIAIQSIQNLVVGTRALETEKEVTMHEDLHKKAITCIVVSKNGAYFATGSEDTSVRVWQIARNGSSHQRRVVHVCTLAGHSAAVSCIDMSTEFSLVVSGGTDNNVCVWDFRSKRMLRLLGDHKGPLLSVSINSMSGFIATLTQQQMRLYTLNGELVSYINPSNPLYRAHGSETLSPACVVLATPCDAWQDGVVLVTGHREGYLYLWKLGKPMQDAEEESRDTGRSFSAPLTKESLLDRKVHAYESTTNRTRYRELYISSVPVKIHKANITTLRLCSSAPNKAKDVSRSAEDSKSLDLLVGDADGMVSRWTPLKLDQLGAADLMQVLNSTALESTSVRR